MGNHVNDGEAVTIQRSNTTPDLLGKNHMHSAEIAVEETVGNHVTWLMGKLLPFSFLVFGELRRGALPVHKEKFSEGAGDGRRGGVGPGSATG